MSTTHTDHERRIRRGLFQDGLWPSCQAPRLHLALMVSLTGAIGFYVAYLMLKSDMDAPWLRYPLSIGIAYLTFLLMLSSWVRRRGEEGVTSPAGAHVHSVAEGSAELDGILNDPSLNLDERMVQVDTIDGYDAEALAFVVVASTVLLGAAWAAISIVWRNHVLVVELLLAVGCALALYCRVRDVDEPHRLNAAMRRTLWRAVALALLFALLGAALTRYVPGARGFGELWSALIAVPR